MKDKEIENLIEAKIAVKHEKKSIPKLAIKSKPKPKSKSKSKPVYISKFNPLIPCSYPIDSNFYLIYTEFYPIKNVYSYIISSIQFYIVFFISGLILFYWIF